MLKKERIIKVLKRELPYLENKYGVERVAVFGSFAKGTQRKKSDIDILVKLKKPLGLDFVELAYYLEDVLGKKTDVVTFDCFKSSFRNPRYKHIAQDIRKSLIYV